MDAKFAARMQRWERKLASLEPGSASYTKHMKNKPKSKAKRPASRVLDFSGFALHTKPQRGSA